MEISQNIPALRFSEFEGEWVKISMSEVATKITDGTHDTPKPTESGIPFLTAIHIKDGFIDYDNCYFLPKEEHDKIYKRCNPEKGDLLLVNIGSGTATCAMNTVSYEFGLKNVALIKPNKRFIFPDFLAQIQRKNSAKQFNQLTSGGAQPFLSLKEIGKIKFKIPQIKEQQKIASFLSALDEKTQQLKKKKEHLEQYKDGLMQQIFNQEIRFKDENGNDYPDWEEMALSELGETYNGLTGKTKINFGAGKPYITYMQIFKGSKIDANLCDLVEISDHENQNRVQYGDVFFTTSSETPNEVGFSSVMLEQIDNLYLNSFCFGFRPYSLQQITPNFSRFLFRSAGFRKTIIKLAQGSTRYNMSKVQFLKLKVSFPSFVEQEKIADILSKVDDKIDFLRIEIAESQNFKKGLLQQMFV